MLGRDKKGWVAFIVRSCPSTVWLTGCLDFVRTGYRSDASSRSALFPRPSRDLFELLDLLVGFLVLLFLLQRCQK